ncbi:unnamed protein product [Amoebophrya sp. A120]|nr:unnamed protein product [Amoebophrya sp. A120]|eukprot:GSA120T00008076001.1
MSSGANYQGPRPVVMMEDDAAAPHLLKKVGAATDCAEPPDPDQGLRPVVMAEDDEVAAPLLKKVAAATDCAVCDEPPDPRSSCGRMLPSPAQQTAPGVEFQGILIDEFSSSEQMSSATEDEQINATSPALAPKGPPRTEVERSNTSDRWTSTTSRLAAKDQQEDVGTNTSTPTTRGRKSRGDHQHRHRTHRSTKSPPASKLAKQHFGCRSVGLFALRCITGLFLLLLLFAVATCVVYHAGFLSLTEVEEWFLFFGIEDPFQTAQETLVPLESDTSGREIDGAAAECEHGRNCSTTKKGKQARPHLAPQATRTSTPVSKPASDVAAGVAVSPTTLAADRKLNPSQQLQRASVRQIMEDPVDYGKPNLNLDPDEPFLEQMDDPDEEGLDQDREFEESQRRTTPFKKSSFASSFLDTTLDGLNKCASGQCADKGQEATNAHVEERETTKTTTNAAPFLEDEFEEREGAPEYDFLEVEPPVRRTESASSSTRKSRARAAGTTSRSQRATSGAAQNAPPVGRSVNSEAVADRIINASKSPQSENMRRQMPDPVEDDDERFDGADLDDEDFLQRMDDPDEERLDQDQDFEDWKRGITPYATSSFASSFLHEKLVLGFPNCWGGESAASTDLHEVQFLAPLPEDVQEAEPLPQPLERLEEGGAKGDAKGEDEREHLPSRVEQEEAHQDWLGPIRKECEKTKAFEVVQASGGLVGMLVTQLPVPPELKDATINRVIPLSCAYLLDNGDGNALKVSALAGALRAKEKTGEVGETTIFDGYNQPAGQPLVDFIEQFLPKSDVWTSRPPSTVYLPHLLESILLAENSDILTREVLAVGHAESSALVPPSTSNEARGSSVSSTKQSLVSIEAKLVLGLDAVNRKMMQKIKERELERLQQWIGQLRFDLPSPIVNQLPSLLDGALATPVREVVAGGKEHVLHEIQQKDAKNAQDFLREQLFGILEADAPGTESGSDSATTSADRAHSVLLELLENGSIAGAAAPASRQDHSMKNSEKPQGTAAVSRGGGEVQQGRIRDHQMTGAEQMAGLSLSSKDGGRTRTQQKHDRAAVAEGLAHADGASDEDIRSMCRSKETLEATLGLQDIEEMPHGLDVIVDVIKKKTLADVFPNVCAFFSIEDINLVYRLGGMLLADQYTGQVAEEVLFPRSDEDGGGPAPLAATNLFENYYESGTGLKGGFKDVIAPIMMELELLKPPSQHLKPEQLLLTSTLFGSYGENGQGGKMLLKAAVETGRTIFWIEKGESQRSSAAAEVFEAHHAALGISLLLEVVEEMLLFRDFEKNGLVNPSLKVLALPLYREWVTHPSRQFRKFKSLYLDENESRTTDHAVPAQHSISTPVQEDLEKVLGNLLGKDLFQVVLRKQFPAAQGDLQLPPEGDAMAKAAGFGDGGADDQVAAPGFDSQIRAGREARGADLMAQQPGARGTASGLESRSPVDDTPADDPSHAHDHRSNLQSQEPGGGGGGARRAVAPPPAGGSPGAGTHMQSIGAQPRRAAAAPREPPAAGPSTPLRSGTSPQQSQTLQGPAAPVQQRSRRGQGHQAADPTKQSAQQKNTKNCC